MLILSATVRGMARPPGRGGLSTAMPRFITNLGLSTSYFCAEPKIFVYCGTPCQNKYKGQLTVRVYGREPWYGNDWKDKWEPFSVSTKEDQYRIYNEIDEFGAIKRKDPQLEYNTPLPPLSNE